MTEQRETILQKIADLLSENEKDAEKLRVLKEIQGEKQKKPSN